MVNSLQQAMNIVQNVVKIDMNPTNLEEELMIANIVVAMDVDTKEGVSQIRVMCVVELVMFLIRH